jgi:hypothetical protein
MSLTFRVTAMAAASGTKLTSGFEAVSAWAGGGRLRAVVVHSGYPAAWSGWAAIVLGVPAHDVRRLDHLNLLQSRSGAAQIFEESRPRGAQTRSSRRRFVFVNESAK